jgi:hypothetical protein
MPKRALVFAVSLIIIGAATVGAALTMWSSISANAFPICLALALFGATLKVPVPGMTGTISPAIVPILFAAGAMSGPEAVIIAALAGLTQCLWRAKRRPTSLQVLFNGANHAISGGLAFGISHRVAASGSLLLFLVATVVFHLVDTLSVAAILSLLEDKPLRALWHNCHLWSFPYILAGGGFTAAWAQASVPVNFRLAVICAIVLYLMSAFYREVIARTNRSLLEA